MVIQGHAVQNALPAFLAAQQLLNGKRQFLTLDALPVPLLKGHKKCGGVGVRVVVGQLTVACAVKGRVEPVAVEQVYCFIEVRSCQILHGEIDLGGILVDVGRRHLHADAVVFTGPLHRLEELGRGRGDGIQQLVKRRAEGCHGRDGQPADQAKAGHCRPPFCPDSFPLVRRGVRRLNIGGVDPFQFI